MAIPIFSLNKWNTLLEWLGQLRVLDCVLMFKLNGRAGLSSGNREDKDGGHRCYVTPVMNYVHFMSDMYLRILERRID